jgi:hypothetical protein
VIRHLRRYLRARAYELRQLRYFSLLTWTLDRSSHWRWWWGNPRYEWLHDHRAEIRKLDATIDHTIFQPARSLPCQVRGHAWEPEEHFDICARCDLTRPAPET